MTKSNGFNMELKGLDDLFTTEEERADDKLERVKDIPLGELHPFCGHPFKVQDDDAMKEMVKSIEKYGVLTPAIARPDGGAGYELISGHRRRRACERLGLTTMPVMIRELDDDAATLIMVDSNLQRENLLPSEKALSYKMKLEAIKHQGYRSDLASGQVDQRWSIEKVADDAGENYKQVQRYIHLTELCPDLLDMVDKKKIRLTTGYELAFLKTEEQNMLLEVMGKADVVPSLIQARSMKKISQEGMLTAEVIRELMSSRASRKPNRTALSYESVRKYFPEDCTQEEMQNTIIRLLERWQTERASQTI